MKTCPQCQVKYPDALEFCPRDGSPLPALLGGVDRSDPIIGSTIDGRYLIEERLGEGGMGVVYRAKHVLIDKSVAIKILRREAAQDSASVQRFIQEAKSASKIGHSNIVDITDFGVLPDGHAYFVMEFLQGPTLAQALQDGPLDPARVCTIGAQMARGLHAAHTKGIVHRDLKPENIFLLEREEQKDFVKVVDFGIAKVGGGQKLTQVGMVLGTPEYMSPEQATGQETDHRVDQYALGCMMYEMLTGIVPFLGERPAQTLTKHVFEAVVPPRQRKPELNIPQSLEAVVMRTIAKKAAERFPSMRDLEQALLQVEAELRSGRVVIDDSRIYASGRHGATAVAVAAPSVEPVSSNAAPTQAFPQQPVPTYLSPSQVSAPAAAYPSYPSGVSIPSPSSVSAVPPSSSPYASAQGAAVYVAAPPRPTRETLPTQIHRRRRSIYAAVGGALLVLALLFLYLLVFDRPPAPVPTLPPEVEVRKAPPPPAPVPEIDKPKVEVPPPAPRPVQILVRSTPSGANVYVNGDRVGQTPLTLTRDRNAAFQLELRKGGHQPSVRDIVATASQELVVALQRKGDGKKPKKGTKDPSVPTQASPPAHDGLRNPFGPKK